VNIVRRWWPVWVALLGPIAVLVFLRANQALDVSWFSADGHVAIMTVVAALALAVAGMSIHSSLRTNQPGVVWMAIGCATVGLLLLGHGLTTPGALGQPANLWVGRLPYFAMAAIGFCLFVAGRSPRRRPNNWVGRHPVAALAAFVLPVAVLVVWVSIDPLSLSGGAPLPHEVGVLRGLSVAIVGSLLAVIWTHWRRWHLGRDVVQLAIVLSAASCIAAVGSFELGEFSHMSWWNYHGYLLAGFAMAEEQLPGRFRVVIASADGRPMTSMGGLRVTPDAALTAYDPGEISALILPGAATWSDGHGVALDLALRVLAADGLVAGICGRRTVSRGPGCSTGARTPVTPRTT